MALELITSGWLTAPSYFIGGVALPLVGNDSIVKKRVFGVLFVWSDGKNINYNIV